MLLCPRRRAPLSSSQPAFLGEAGLHDAHDLRVGFHRPAPLYSLSWAHIPRAPSHTGPSSSYYSYVLCSILCTGRARTFILPRRLHIPVCSYLYSALARPNRAPRSLGLPSLLLLVHHMYLGRALVDTPCLSVAPSYLPSSVYAFMHRRATCFCTCTFALISCSYWLSVHPLEKLHCKDCANEEHRRHGQCMNSKPTERQDWIRQGSEPIQSNSAMPLCSHRPSTRTVPADVRPGKGQEHPRTSKGQMKVTPNTGPASCSVRAAKRRVKALRSGRAYELQVRAESRGTCDERGAHERREGVGCENRREW